ncbi:uncharacterized protein LOC113771107 [Coffea eugenioides]|uniref:uncharacterized protein LOC113771107 n=1 Tax=Coffea eugenioides TaxID=49369 RepID=UPI000F60E93A|nr:uncharacterized protein LOC113771107 [Coffea eugenioides]
MRVLVWNCQEVGSPLTVPHLREVNNLFPPNLIFLSEIKNRKQAIDRIARELRFDSNVAVEAMNKAGGIALFWTKETHILEVYKTAFTIEAKIEDNDTQVVWWFVGVYASCDPMIRKEQWRVLSNRKRLWGTRYMIIRDFNDILSNEEKWEGVVSEERRFRDFKDFMNQNSLIDIGFEGQPWTWSNHWDNEGEVRQRLGRCLCSFEWFQDFEKARCQHIDTFTSNHYMLLLDTAPGKERKKKRFYFDKRWFQRERVQQVVEKAWHKEEQGSRMFKITKKIRNCRIKLLKWRNTFQANSRSRITDLKKDLKRVWDSVSENRKESKARISWLREGDKNTKYFHTYVKGRRVNNRIRNLQRENGSWTENEEEVVTEMSEFFKELFNSGGRSDMSEILEGISHSITQEMNDKLTKAVEKEEIHDALFSMHPEKAPGQDGMSPLFFQRFWSTIKGDIIPAVKAFFSSGFMLKSVNHTVISLILKILHPTSLKNFRPISLCGVLYKIISKILANRLKSVLDKCISKTQSAFIPDRQILGNVVLAHEYMHYLKNKRQGKEGYMAIKLDVAKAYDRVE